MIQKNDTIVLEKKDIVDAVMFHLRDIYTENTLLGNFGMIPDDVIVTVKLKKD